MRVLIIGGTGLISTAITRVLIGRGDDVTLYNRGQTKADIPERYNTITGNRKDYAAFEAQMTETGNFDAVIDMIGFVPADIESAIRAFRGNIGQFIFCSSDIPSRLLRGYVALSVGSMPVNTFTAKMNLKFTTKLLEDGSISVRKRLFSGRLTMPGHKCSVQSFFILGVDLESFVSYDNIGGL